MVSIKLFTGLQGLWRRGSDSTTKLERIPAPSKKKWWFRIHGTLWQEWAIVLPGGYVAIYDEHGQSIRRCSYGSRFRARAALRLKGFRQLRRKDLEVVSPPEID